MDSQIAPMASISEAIEEMREIMLNASGFVCKIETLVSGFS